MREPVREKGGPEEEALSVGGWGGGRTPMQCRV